MSLPQPNMSANGAPGVPGERPGLIGGAAHWRRHSAPPQAIVMAPPNIVLSQVPLRHPV